MATATLDLKKTTAAVQAVRAKAAELEARIRTFEGYLNPFSADAERRPSTAEQRLSAEAYLPQARIDYAKARLELTRLEADAESARLAERDKFVSECIADERKLVAELNKVLLTAISINEKLRAAQQHRHEMTGAFVERASWMTLSTEDGAFYSNWRRVCVANGLMDE